MEILYEDIFHLRIEMFFFCIYLIVCLQREVLTNYSESSLYTSTFSTVKYNTFSVKPALPSAMITMVLFILLNIMLSAIF